jgi:cytochrome P450
MSSRPLAEPPAHVLAAHVVDWDMYAPPGVEAGFHDAWGRLLADDMPAMLWTPRNEGHWIAARGDLIAQVFADAERFSSRVIMVPKSDGEHHNMIPTTIDPPAHRPWRMLLNDGLSPRAVRAVERQVRAIAARLVDAVRPDGGCDFITAYAERLPIEIFLTIVGLPLADAPRLKRLADQITRPDGSMSFPQAVQGFYDYLAPTLAARRGGDGTDMLTTMVNGTVDGRPLSDREALQLSAQVLIAGLDTVVNFVGFAMLHLARDRALAQRLAATPADIPAAVDELFRRYGIVTIGREVRADIDFGGVALKAGEMVMCPSALHGMDERANANALAVDIDRTAAHHSTFGQGHHKCPGAQLARTELRVTLEEWLVRIPRFALAPGADIRCAGGIVGCVTLLPLVWSA